MKPGEQTGQNKDQSGQAPSRQALCEWGTHASYIGFPMIHLPLFVSCLQQFVFLAVMKNTASVINQESASVVWASVGVTVTTASVTQAASMAPVSSLGNATARRAGVGSSATRVSLLTRP